MHSTNAILGNRSDLGTTENTHVFKTDRSPLAITDASSPLLLGTVQQDSAYSEMGKTNTNRWPIHGMAPLDQQNDIEIIKCMEGSPPPKCLQ